MVVNGMLCPGLCNYHHTDNWGNSLVLSGHLDTARLDNGGGGRAPTIDTILKNTLYGPSYVPESRAMYMGHDGAPGYSASWFFVDGTPNSTSLVSDGAKSPVRAYEKFIQQQATANSSQTPPPSPSEPVVNENLILDKSILTGLEAEKLELLRDSRLSQLDKDMLTSYFDNLSDLRARASVPSDTRSETPTVSGCTVPSSSQAFTPASGNVEDICAQYAKIIKTAFVCDATRVVGIQLYDGSNKVRTVRDAGGDSHNGFWHVANAPAPAARFGSATGDYISIVAGIAEELRNTPIGEGKNLLDETLVLFVTDFGMVSQRFGNNHFHTDYSYISFGGKDVLKTGFYYDGLDGVGRVPVGEVAWSLNHYLQTILHAFDVGPSKYAPFSPSGAAHLGTYVDANNVPTTFHTTRGGGNRIPLRARTASEKASVISALLR